MTERTSDPPPDPDRAQTDDGQESDLLTAVTLLSGDALREALRRYPADFGGFDGLARALAASPLWGEAPRATLVLRDEPHPSLSVLGYLDASVGPRLAALRRDLPRVLRTLHYVDYSRAESDCIALAESLTKRLGRERIEQSSFAAIPRGGFIVLGMLAYALGLRADQLTPPPPGAPLVLVDDCALTGARLRECLTAYPQADISFAMLYAHPDLCAAVEREERVRACLSAHPLTDHAPAHLGDAYEAWRTRWDARTDRFWIGLPDHVCFAWNEPDIALWNAADEVAELGWYAVPRTGLRDGGSTAALPIVMQRPGAYLSLAPSVIYAAIGSDMVVCDAESGTGLTLSDSAAEVFQIMTRAEDEAEAIERVVATENVSSDWANLHVQRVRLSLTAAGLIAP